MPPKTSRELKLRFGLHAFGSLIFALRRSVCVAHPEVAGRALRRLLDVHDVHNPGAYFFRVFTDELAASQQLAPSLEDIVLEREREVSLALRTRQKVLEAELERAQGVDWEAAERIRAKLDAVCCERRRRHYANGRGEHAQSPLNVLARGSEAATTTPGNAEPLSPAEQQAESERVLAMLRKRRAAA